MTKWEYMVIDRQIKPSNVKVDTLNIAGRKGWELIHVEEGCFIFKRPLKRKNFWE